MDEHTTKVTPKRQSSVEDPQDPESSHEFKTKYSGTFSIVVGNNYSDPFNVHESLLVSSSEFFKTALSADWKENRLKVLHLSCYKPVNFQIHMDWLYACGHVNIADLVTESLAHFGVPAPDEKDLWVIDQLCEVWILGDYLLDNEFKDTVIKSILCLRVTNLRIILPDTVERIVDGTLTDSGLYRWLLDHLASVLTPNDLEKIEHILPQSVLLPLLKRVISGRRCPPVPGNSCHPHVSRCERYHEKSPEKTAEAERHYQRTMIVPVASAGAALARKCAWTPPARLGELHETSVL
ncbi:hypothetical protein KC333_g151 [Hortaea werneckii]|nr:hypothetical protein KC333_g151 [Hortaea werneckii]